ncbi:hypothetical protein [Bradyrhizobium sp. 145]|uniref:hypothetical protein n=1 Tax=Bradyrhizobium sp. 145 TaxID=2782621 RepID=UPI001FFBF72E|nr:hypothetical protein [Bradyrhizobium sp. 145]MCK1685638.1 hypothetical protein [Bradyrhizobium sp. 145]
MNAHVPPIDWLVTDIDLDPFDAIDPRITQKARRLHRIHRWVFFPYCWTNEPSGALLLDRKYHPLCRKQPDGTVEILPVADIERAPLLKPKRLRFLYGSLDHPCDTDETQQRLLCMVRRLGLEDEVYRRYEALDRVFAERRRNFRRYLARLR